MDLQYTVENMSGNMIAKLNRIRLFLNEGRASVMVGAGFSRNAEKEAHVMMKDWNSLAEDIYEQLYAKKPTAADLAFKTPMRLASLLASNIGRSGLDQVIKDSLPDDLISPGKLHHQLMQLNWRDVFTTNYDTLLERAAENSGRYYKVVTSKEMLLYKSSPRIIKLHGSFPDKTPFLMTEEEFRTYPTDHPEFVNTVRQALVESVFCLIGFSGDDPNFTSWQAWLRDVMGDYASPTYLITFDEKYDDSFKKLMMSRGIEVLNLAEIKGLEDYKSALEFFFSYLGQKNDVNWKPNISFCQDVDTDNLILCLKKIRESYPGWFVLPKEYYIHFRDFESNFPYFQNVVDNISDNQKKEKLLLELDWCAEVALFFKDHDWYIQIIEDLIEKNRKTTFGKGMMNLALSLLRIYRHHPEKKEKKERLILLLREQVKDMSESQKRRYYYTMAGNLLSELDYESLELLLREWKPLKNDYDGIIYKALVIAEGKGISESSRMIGEALERISKILLKETSEELLSRKASLEFLSSFYCNDKRPEIPSKYSFLSLSDYFMRKCRVANPSVENISHGFAIGSVSRVLHFSSGFNPHLLYPLRHLLLCERYGLPYGLPKSSVDEELLKEIVGYLNDFSIEYSISIVLRSGSRKVAEKALSRAVLAGMTRNQSEELTNRLLEMTKKTAPTEALEYRIKEVLNPLLCRLSTKVSSELKRKIFHVVCKHFKKDDNKAIEDVKILYDAMMPEDMPSIINEIFSKKIDLDKSGRDFPYPNIGYEEFVPNEKHLKIILEDLESSKENVLLAALTRTDYLLNSKITAKQRTIIEKHIINRRKSTTIERYYWDSFTLVKADKTELSKVHSEINQIIDKVLTTDYFFNNSSLEISGLTGELTRITKAAELLSNKQKSNLYRKISKILDDNKFIVNRNDFVGIMGGMRKYFIELLEEIKRFVCHVVLMVDDREAYKDLFNVICFFADCGLPVRTIMELLNNRCKTVKSYVMREMIIGKLFDDDRNVIVDSLNALILHAKNGGNVQIAYQKIIHFCTTDITQSTNVYIDCLAHTDLSKLTKKTKSELGLMMTSLYERIPKCSIPTEYKVDLLHSCIALLKTIQNETGISSIKEASILWIQYVNDSDTFDDVKRAYYE
ncbi:MAG: SIR2 family protein [Bacteroidales bacterium]|nr:SIR2 family protein [Bacteroidales bacterium]